MTHDLQQILNDYGFDKSYYDTSYYYQFMDAVLLKNQVMNLTGITDPQEFFYKHYIDSLSLLKHYPITESDRVLDLGTGAGFPGVPIKLYTNCKITLLDALNKRIKFINETLEPLGLNNFEAVHGRAEELAAKKLYRGQFDYVVTRAVAHTRVLAEMSIPFLKKSGIFIALKGPQYGAELDECKTALVKLGSEVVDIIPFQIKEFDLSHYIIVIRKTKETEIIYPRKFSLIQTNPL
jgi:16S rRNA (guanine527-N7)-methyltransferase